ncbi:hypothetical protein COLO4_24583 [Corchorus olitorius]|uniref:Uncharacterized protein n=1 Tax=Corchorus olitorius TaxID=93759 RepID=A0A1R3I932_9ROSI|nr:hypothetical protein COLO4_24583 [Corchorus olitorius]
MLVLAHASGRVAVLPVLLGKLNCSYQCCSDDPEAQARIDRKEIWDSVAVDSKGRTIGMGNLVHSTHRGRVNPLAKQNIQLQTRVDELVKRGSKQAKDNRKLKKRLSHMEANHKSLLEVVRSMLLAHGIPNPQLPPLVEFTIGASQSCQASKQQSEHHPNPDADMDDEYGTSASEDEVDDDNHDDLMDD